MKENDGEREINGFDFIGGGSLSAVDCFYEKLRKLNESSGLSLIFNFRQTSLDLYKLYEQVTARGGYHQNAYSPVSGFFCHVPVTCCHLWVETTKLQTSQMAALDWSSTKNSVMKQDRIISPINDFSLEMTNMVTKDKKWGVVASSMDSEGSSILPDKLQIIYENVLCPFEKIHHYRTSAKITAKESSTKDDILSGGDCLSRLSKKRKHSPVSIICYDAKELESAKRKSNSNKSNKSLAGQRSIKKKSNGETSVEDEEIQFDLEVPLKPRNAYQLFLTEECKRLKKFHGERSENMNFRGMASKAWRELPVEKRKPYIEESKKDKERYDQEMKTYEDEKNNPILKPRNRPFYKEDLEKPVVSSSKMIWPIKDGDYHVTVQPAPENINLPKESDIELAIQSIKNEPVNDTVFQINLEEYWSIDLPGLVGS